MSDANRSPSLKPIPTHPTARQRVTWADTAKGIAIVLVVLHHAAQRLLYDGLAAPGWLYATEMLRTLRMPLFFLVAGLFAAKWLMKPWAELGRAKLLLFGWVFALWTAITWLVMNLEPGGAAFRNGASDLVREFAWPEGVWFLYALAIFFVMAKVTGRAPVPVQMALAAAAATAWFGGVVYVGNHTWDGIGQFYVFFLLGCYGREVLFRAVERVGLTVRLLLIASWVGAYVIAEQFGLVDALGVSFGLRLLALGAGISLATFLAGWSALQYLGRHTLPIYVSHQLIVATVAWFIAASGFFDGYRLAALILPIVLAAIGLALSLALMVAADRLNLGWLFAAPRVMRRLRRDERS